MDPKLYYFWQCPNCAFTADHNFFTEPFKDGSMTTGRFRKIFLRSREASTSFPDIVKRLRLNPKSESSAFLSGLKLNLLAIFMWEMMEEFAKGDSLILGSYYLRLGWLLRDVRVMESKNPAVFKAVRSLVEELRTIWPQLQISETATLTKALFYYRQGLAKSPSVKTLSDEVTVKLIVARLEMKLGRLDEAKRQIIESRSRINNYEQIHRAELEAQPDKALGRTKTTLANVELLYEKVEDALAKQDPKVRRSS